MKTDNQHTASSSVCTCTTEDFVIPGNVIVTAPFKSSAADYFSLAIWKTAAKWWWIAVLPIITFCALALIDLRWLFVALIFLFLVIPFFIANIYFSRLLTSHAQLALASKTLKITSGIRIEISILDDEEKVIRTVTIPWKEIKEIKENTNSWLISLKNYTKNEIIVPKHTIVNKYPLQNRDNAASPSDFFD